MLVVKSMRDILLSSHVLISKKSNLGSFNISPSKWNIHHSIWLLFKFIEFYEQKLKVLWNWWWNIRMNPKAWTILYIFFDLHLFNNSCLTMQKFCELHMPIRIETDDYNFLQSFFSELFTSSGCNSFADFKVKRVLCRKEFTDASNFEQVLWNLSRKPNTP